MPGPVYAFGPHSSVQLPGRRLERGGYWPLFPDNSDRMRGDGIQLCQWRVRLGVRKTPPKEQ